MEDHALITPRAKHYSNINEGTNIYITPSPSVRRLALARSLENGQRQQVGEGGTNGREQAARPMPDQEWHFTVYTSGEARELLTYQAIGNVV